MNIEGSLAVLDALAVILSGGVLIWLVKAIAGLKAGIEAQKVVIDSLKSHSDYVEGIQGLVSKLYDPVELDKVIQIKVSEKLHNLKMENKALRDSKEEILAVVLGIAARGAIDFDDSGFEFLLDVLGNLDSSQNYKDFVVRLRAELRIEPQVLESFEGEMPPFSAPPSTVKFIPRKRRRTSSKGQPDET